MGFLSGGGDTKAEQQQQQPMKMDLERIGSRHRDNSHVFAAESEALDQIAKDVRKGAVNVCIHLIITNKF